MNELLKLVSGYKEFSKGQKPGGQYRYSGLAEGQSPKIMVISCSDSRVIPSQIFNVEPGDLFIVRNVANLVPPYEEDQSYHGTSAALEFAVNYLDVGLVVILGHSQCGGIHACAENFVQGTKAGTFLDKWLSILNPVAEKMLTGYDGPIEGQLQTDLELAAIRESLSNLEQFPFLSERLKDGRLTVHGAYFDITDGQLYLLDAESDAFKMVE
ncbi:MAG: carbonic anhydrase [Alphaproteobacteria bacterium]|nr:MAG: carbonic anhydrase [Alphaproteobacteria bacterium]